MKKPKAAFIAILLACLAYALVVVLTDRFDLNTSVPPGRQQRAVVAIRDDVTPFQKWGTKQFTLPYLNRYYDASWYFTQSAFDDCKGEFLSALNTALTRYPEVDILLLSHSNSFVWWVAELPPERRRRIRLVYNTGCCNLQQGPVWLGLGAKAYVGHPGDSTSAVFYVYFLRRWVRGSALRQAVDDANALMRLTLARTQFVSFGKVNAEEEYQGSEASCHGEDGLRLSGSR